jgi:hypothetical protein
MLDPDEKQKIPKLKSYGNLAILNTYLVCQLMRGILVYHRVQFVQPGNTYLSGFSAFFDQNCIILGPLAICTTLAKYLTNPMFIENCAKSNRFFWMSLLEPVVTQAWSILVFTLLCMYFFLWWDVLFSFEIVKAAILTTFLIVTLVMGVYVAGKLPIEIKKPADAAYYKKFG